jgi:hypothetical protein
MSQRLIRLLFGPLLLVVPLSALALLEPTFSGVFTQSTSSCDGGGCLDPVTGQPVVNVTPVEIPFTSPQMPTWFIGGSGYTTDETLPNGNTLQTFHQILYQASGYHSGLPSFTQSLLTLFGATLDATPIAFPMNEVRTTTLSNVPVSSGITLGTAIDLSDDFSITHDTVGVSFKGDIPFIPRDSTSMFWTPEEVDTFLTIAFTSGASFDMTAYYNPYGTSNHYTLTGSARIATLRYPDQAGPPIPEPSAWALMLAGFGLVLRTVRRRYNAMGRHQKFTRSRACA